MSMAVTVETKTCIVCGEKSLVEITQGQLDRWEGGELIQRVFPEWTASRRELLITGTHPACWTKMFATGGDENDV